MLNGKYPAGRVGSVNVPVVFLSAKLVS